MITTLVARGISKSFGKRSVLSTFSREFVGGAITGIVGPNGSGKSTLAKILAGLLRPDTGDVELRLANQMIQRVDIPFHCGYVAPYLTLYDEFTPHELLVMHGAFHGIDLPSSSCDEIIQRVGLSARATSRVRTFSSGMRQRVALALAVSIDPAVLVLDEPSTTLDESGRLILTTEIQRASQRGAIVLIATNDARERDLCTHTIEVA